MQCEKVLPLLSEYFDESLDADTEIQVSQHLDQCTDCRKELDDIHTVHCKLKSLKGVQVPEYLRNLVHLRLADMAQDRWRVRIQNALERRWSIIRTTEGMWYMTKALGIIMTSVFFFLIPNSISPLQIETNSSLPERAVYTQAEKQRVAMNVLANLGMLPKDAQKELARPKQPETKPAIHDQYVSNFGQSISQEGNDYDISVLAYVDRSGQGTIQNVLEHPNDRSFRDSIDKVISSGRFAPARENGEAVSSHMLLIFSKISVYTNKD
jgi:hypothetical protein